MSSHLEPPFAAVLELMSAFRAPWFLCGGWAVDSWLGRTTRAHGDVDISIFEPDQWALFAHLAGWHLIPHDARQPENRRAWDGWQLELPAHIHARPPGEANRALVLAWVTPPYAQAKDGLDFEFVLNERRADDWLLAESPAVALPLGRGIALSPGGVPAAVPEVLMFYKATAYWDLPNHPRPHDLADFAALAPLLSPGAAAWLRGALETVHPRHPWLTYLPG